MERLGFNFKLREKPQKRRKTLARNYLQQRANYLGHGMCRIEASRHQDHRFNGIMFDFEAKSVLPVEHLLITSFSVKGVLGPLKIFVARQSHKEIHSEEEAWTMIFDKNVVRPRSAITRGEFNGRNNMILGSKKLKLDTPLKVSPGEVIGLYIHGTDPEAIVYDDERNPVTYEDELCKVHSGLAHIASRPFSNETDWNGWSWRPNREFVGEIEIVYKFWLWRPFPEVHNRFPKRFKEGVLNLMLCWNSAEGNLNQLNEDVMYLILNMLSWDWFGDLYQSERTEILTSEDRKVRDRHAEVIGWGMGGDWRGYQHLIQQHRLMYLRRTGQVHQGQLAGVQNDEDILIDEDDGSEFDGDDLTF